MDTSNLKDTIERIDEFIAAKKVAVKRGEMRDSLMRNPEFIEVILNGYIKVEEEKLFKILTDPSGESEYSDVQVQMKLDSIRDFKRYVGTENYSGTVRDEARRAPDEIFREEQYRKEVTATFAEEE